MRTLKSDDYVLVVDIGNSTFSTAVFKNNEIVFFKKYNFTKASDEESIRGVIETVYNDVVSLKITVSKVLFSSVAISKTKICLNVLKTIFNVEIVALTNTIKTPYISTQNNEIGTDLYANLVEARVKKSHIPCVVVDFGTALTISATDENGVIIGVVITPGVHTSLLGLFASSPLLETLYSEQSTREINAFTKANNTQNAIDVGLYYGTKGKVCAICDFFENQIGKKCYKIATGGECNKYASFIGIFNEIDEKHTLKGIYDICYKAR